MTALGASTITGTLGAAGNALQLINAGAGNVSLNGGVINAAALDFNGANVVTLNNVGTNNIGTVAFGTNDAGTLALGSKRRA